MKKNFFFKYYLLDFIIKSRGITWQQIESFNYFLSIDLKKIIFHNVENIFYTKENLEIRFSNLKIGYPSEYLNWMEIPVTPNHCRITDSSYNGTIFLDLSYEIEKKKYFFFSFNFCKFPMMLQSIKCILFGKNENQFSYLKECPLDSGGYFVVKGAERVILIQEQILINRISVEQDQQGFVCAVVNSFSSKRRFKNIVILKNKKLYLKHKIFIEDIPIFIFLKALGLEKDEDIIDLIGNEFEEILEWSKIESKITGITSNRQAIHYVIQRFNQKIIEKKKKFHENKNFFLRNEKSFFFNAMNNYILTHLSMENHNRMKLEEKTIFISLMIRRIFFTLNNPRICDNKDYYGNKRLELAGQIIALLFEDLFQKTIKEFYKFYRLNNEKLKKSPNLDLVTFVRQDIITQGLEYSFSTGNWVVKKFKLEKNGVTQTLSRLSFISSLSIITKITSQNEKIRKMRGPRSLYSSQWGMLCPSDTPEGESCGLVKDLALLAHISLKNKSRPIHRLSQDLGLQTFFLGEKGLKSFLDKFPKVFLDGKYLGFHENPSNFLYVFRSLRRSGMIDYYISISWDSISNEINISTDEGRICRPFMIVQFGKIKFGKFQKNLMKKGNYFFKDLLRQGFIEYLDVNEQNNAFIAVNTKYIDRRTTHLEIAPEIILGVCAGMIPFLDHNQSPRNTYQCSMGKQAIGSISFNQRWRTDTVLSLLIYSQKPLVKTKIIYFSGNSFLTSGINACISILSFSGFDLEDSIIINRASVDRGFFRSIMLRKHKILMKNLVCDRKKKEKYFDFAGNFIPNNDSMNDIEKTDFKKKEKNLMYHFEKQLILRWSSKEINGEMVEKIIFSSNFSEIFFAKIILRQIRKPEVGDKFSSRHGQKGICGSICSQKDLPFSNEGIIPDLIMNPHGFPSRMTIGKIMELIGAKISSAKGEFFDGTPFGNVTTKNMKRKLQNIGYSSNGKDIYFSGITGEPMVMEVFSGPVFYQKLKHMVKDKIHARSRGSRSNVTRQPVEGRSKGGGLRFGEMERDCLISYGASETIIERLLISSDLFLANFDFRTGYFTEKSLKQETKKIKLPFACKLLFQELQSMNILVKLKFVPKFSDSNSQTKIFKIKT